MAETETTLATKEMRAFKMSPPGVIALVLGGADIGHQAVGLFGANTLAETEYERKMKSQAILLDLLTVAYLFLGSNFLYNRGMKGLSWGLVAVPLIMVALTIIVSLNELKKLNRSERAKCQQ